MTTKETEKALIPLLEEQQKIADETGLFCGLVVWVPHYNHNVLEHRGMYASDRMEVEAWAYWMDDQYQDEEGFSIYIDGQLWHR